MRRGKPGGSRGLESRCKFVGYSNGGALALKYALDALADVRLTRPDRLAQRIAEGLPKARTQAP